MGDRNCAFEGCNALEFRTSGYCLRHRGGLPDEKTHPITRKPKETGKKDIFEIIGRTEIWWIPIIPLLTFPAFGFDLWYIEQTEVYGTDLSFLYTLAFILTFPSRIFLLCYQFYYLFTRSILSGLIASEKKMGSGIFSFQFSIFSLS